MGEEKAIISSTLRLQPTVWHSDPSSPLKNHRVLMRAFSLILRVLLSSSRLAMFGLLAFTFVTTVAEASSEPAGIAFAKPAVCDPHAATLRSLRVHATKAGPVAKRVKRQRGVVINTAPARLSRVSHRASADDDEAIQSDSPVVHTELDERQAPALRPLGLLSSSLDRRPFDRLSLPRSPRGPPPTT